jgi:metal-responsive CopG/Arc/MetJ family transcriptional regulator
MGRRAIRGKTGTNRRQLCAVLPEQLVIKFNSAAAHGKRDELVKDALEAFLEKRTKYVAAPSTRVERRQFDRIHEISTERDAVALAKYHANAILEIAAVVAKVRKGPKSARPTGKRRRRKVS